MTFKCTIIGWFGYSNIGDELLLNSVLSRLQKDGLEITVISANPKQTTKIHNVKAIPTGWSALNNLRHADLIVFGGGQIFSDKRMRTIPLWTLLIRMVRALNKNCRFIFLNQGFEAQSSVMRRFLKIALSNAKAISIRDSDSYALIQSLGLNVPVSLGPDIVFSLDLAKHRTLPIQGVRSRVAEAVIGVNVRPSSWWSDASVSDVFERVLASALDKILDTRSARVVFVPFRFSGKEPDSDEETSKSIIKMMRNKDKTEIFSAPLDENLIGSIVSCYSQFDLFIGTALHSLIMAHKLQTPLLALPYQKKCSMFLKDAELVNSAITPPELVSLDSLYARISNALDAQKKCSFTGKRLYADSVSAHVSVISQEILFYS